MLLGEGEGGGPGWPVTTITPSGGDGGNVVTRGAAVQTVSARLVSSVSIFSSLFLLTCACEFLDSVYRLISTGCQLEKHIRFNFCYLLSGKDGENKKIVCLQTYPVIKCHARCSKSHGSTLLV